MIEKSLYGSNSILFLFTTSWTPCSCSLFWYNGGQLDSHCFSSLKRKNKCMTWWANFLEIKVYLAHDIEGFALLLDSALFLLIFCGVKILFMVILFLFTTSWTPCSCSLFWYNGGQLDSHCFSSLKRKNKCMTWWANFLEIKVYLAHDIEGFALLLDSALFLLIFGG